ncbi:MAG: hypothetical protein ABH872_07330 [Candidatus Omnitrophota bacterium]
MLKIMKTRNIYALCVVSCVLCLGTAYAEVTSIQEVLSSPALFDKKQVEIEGEIIGELLNDKAGAWVNISDRGNNIGIFLPGQDMVKNISYWGKYGIIGDRVKVTGTFFNNCSQHQEIDVHSEKIEVIKAGFKDIKPPSPRKIEITLALFIIWLTITIVYLIRLYISKI